MASRRRFPRKRRKASSIRPDHITRFLVEHTIGKSLEEAFARALKIHAGLDGPGTDGEYQWTPEQEGAV